MRKVTILLVLAALGLVAGAGYYLLSGEGEQAGKSLASLQGAFNDVQWRKSKQLSFRAADVGQALFANDRVKTGTDSRAVVHYESGLVLNVDPESLVTISEPLEMASSEILVERGSVTGAVRKGFAAPKTVIFRDSEGRAIATLTPQGSGEGVEYRVNVINGKASSISILKGQATIDHAGQKTTVAANHALDLATGESVALPPFPVLEAPTADATLDLSAGDGTATLGWAASPRAARYHVQVSRDESFLKLAVDRVLAPDERKFTFKAPGTGSYHWRVAGADAQGREGEYGFPNRFIVTAIPGAAPPPPVEPETIVIEEAFKVRARAQGGLFRSRKGAKDFSRLTGNFELRDGDIVRADDVGLLAFGTGSGLEFAPGSRALFASSKADKTGKRKEMTMRLESGAVTADLGRRGDVSLLKIHAKQALVTVRATDKATRARAEIMPNGSLRITNARGTAMVKAGGVENAVEAGYAVDIADGKMGAPTKLLGTPEPLEPRDRFSVPYQDSPPLISFTWKPVTGAARYRFAVFTGAKLNSVVGSYTTDKTQFDHNALKAGSYAWAVYAQDIDGRESVEAVTRRLEITQDRTAPVLTLTSPCQASTRNSTENSCSHTSTSSTVELSGKSSKPDVVVRVEGKRVPVGKDGTFRAPVEVFPEGRFYSVEVSDKAKNYSALQVRLRKE
jgi:hypothetical protein